MNQTMKGKKPPLKGEAAYVAMCLGRVLPSSKYSTMRNYMKRSSIPFRPSARSWVRHFVCRLMPLEDALKIVEDYNALTKEEWRRMPHWQKEELKGRVATAWRRLSKTASCEIFRKATEERK